jgi:fructose-1-phosphate kinase PfkB-like protein
MNESETAILPGRAPDDVQDWNVPEKDAKAFIDLGVSHVIITLGHRGDYYTTKDGKPGHVPVMRVKAKHSIGAGSSERTPAPFNVPNKYHGTGLKQISIAVTASSVRTRWNESDKSGWEGNIGKAIMLACKAVSKSIQELGAREALLWTDKIED